MLMSDGLLRVFWPYDLPRSSSPGVIVGWRNSELDLFVLTVLEDVEVGTTVLSMPLGQKLTTTEWISRAMLKMPSVREFYFAIVLIRPYVY